MSKSTKCIICKSKVNKLLYCNGCHHREMVQTKLKVYTDLIEVIDEDVDKIKSDYMKKLRRGQDE